MGIDTEVGSVFFNRKGVTIRHLEKHQDMPMEYWYVHGPSGREFDVRDMPDKYFDSDRAAALAGDREAHRRVIMRAVDANYQFKIR